MGDSRSFHICCYHGYLSERAAQFDMGRCRKLSLGAHGERTRLQAVQVGHDQQQVRCGFHRQEAAARDIYSQSVVEAFDRCTDRRLKLDDIQPSIKCLKVKDEKKKKKL